MCEGLPPTLSICIPTFNRSSALNQVLMSITSQAIFLTSDEIEVVISDNCSIDNTKIIAESFVAQFPTKIKYSVNDINIFDKNFQKVLSIATGVFLKLHNDTSVFIDNGLEELLSTVQKSIQSKPILFFSNGSCRGLPKIGVVPFFSFEEFINKATVCVTWIGAFGIWREDYARIEDFDRAAARQLAHTDSLFRVFEWKRNGLINNKVLSTTIQVGRKSRYDLLGVFTDNYFGILEQTIERNGLSIEAFNLEKRRVLYRFLVKIIAETKADTGLYDFDVSEWQSRLGKHFSISELSKATLMVWAHSLLYIMYKIDNRVFKGQIMLMIKGAKA